MAEKLAISKDTFADTKTVKRQSHETDVAIDDDLSRWSYLSIGAAAASSESQMGSGIPKIQTDSQTDSD